MEPPQNLEAEAACLGAALISTTAAANLVRTLKAEHFYRPANQEIFTCISALIKRGSQADLLTLRVALEENKMLERVGGSVYLIQLTEACPSALNAPHYAQIVLDKAYLRDRAEHARQVLDLCHKQGATVDDIIRLSSQVPAHGSSAQPITPEELDIFAQHAGVSTGYPSVDALTRVGYVAGQLSVIAADSKHGKTSWMSCSAIKAAQAGHRVLYATFADLDATGIMKRFYQHKFGIPPDRDLEKYRDSRRQQLVGLPVRWFEVPKHGRTVEDLVRVSLDWEERGMGADIIFVDYIQRISSEQKFSSQVHEIERVSQELFYLARSLSIPVVVASQITKDQDGSTRTKGGRGPEHDAAVKVTLKRFVDSGNRLKCLVDVTHNRFGPPGEIPMVWDEDRLMFMEPSWSGRSAQPKPRQVVMDDPYADD